MVLIKKFSFITVLMIIVLLVAIVGNFYEPLSEVSSGVTYKPQIILDAGHGGLTNTID